MGRSLRRKAQLSIPQLFIVIAVLVVCVIACAVLLTTSSQLRETSQISARNADDQLLTNPVTITITGTDGLDGNLEHFSQIIKLGPGSKPLHLNQLFIYVNTHNLTASITYRGVGAEAVRNFTEGYYTLPIMETIDTVIDNTTSTSLTNDPDSDGLADSLTITAAGHPRVSLSGGTNVTFTTINCSGAGQALAGTYVAPSNSYITSISANGSCSNSSVAAGTLSVAFRQQGMGFYTATYLHHGVNSQEGRLDQGDVIVLDYELPRPVVDDEEVDVTFVPKTGKVSKIMLLTPEVISKQCENLYPTY